MWQVCLRAGLANAPHTDEQKVPAINSERHWSTPMLRSTLELLSALHLAPNRKYSHQSQSAPVLSVAIQGVLANTESRTKETRDCAKRCATFDSLSNT